MRIIVDIGHPAHINFFKHSIEKLAKSHDVYITYLDRGVLPKIIEREFKGYKTFKIGKHKGTKFSIIFHANIFRFLSFFFFVLYHRIDAAINGAFPLGLAMKICGRKYIQFDDDFERKLVVRIEKTLANKLFFPMIVPETPGITKFNALKEWSYLSPQYFVPDKNALTEFGLEEKKYFFIREVSNKTLNYMQQSAGIIQAVAKEINLFGYKVVLSLEDKSNKEFYPEDWIILKEPVADIHSLIYYAKIMISSGDSMAREGAMLGIPSIYCGSREMLANKVLINENMLFHYNPIEMIPFINKVINEEIVLKKQTYFREYLFNKWDDITGFIINEVELLKKTK